MLTKEEALEKLYSVHKDKYQFIIEGSIGVDDFIGAYCPKHNFTWRATFHNLFYGARGCKFCGKERSSEKRRLKKEEYLDCCRKTHNDLENYDFEKFDINDRDKQNRLKIYCNKHGYFRIRLDHFRDGYGCPICGGWCKKDEDVREELSKIHPDLDFSVTKYSEHDKNYRIDVICPKHGLRHLNYYNMRRGQGCDICRYDKISKKKRIKYEEFVQRAEKVHGKGTYIYNEDIMSNRTEDGKIRVICPKHGEFEVSLPNFIRHKSGCPICGRSHLENEVMIKLGYEEIKYEIEKDFPWLKYRQYLHLDFYLPEYNVAIECQGAQHFRPVEQFGGEKVFKTVLKRDNAKRKLCEENGIRLLYFSHENIEFPYKVITDIDELINEVKKNSHI